jgi:3-oxoacyl-[acyl-carrier protein] reductase
MAKRKFGRIIDITSGCVRADRRARRLVRRARASPRSWRRRRALARDNVTIKSIQPGAFETDRQRSALERVAAQRGVSLETARAEAQTRNPAGRFGDPAGALCASLASARAAFITGQNILIAGGAFPGAF